MDNIGLVLPLCQVAWFEADTSDFEGFMRAPALVLRVLNFPSALLRQHLSFVGYYRRYIDLLTRKLFTLELLDVLRVVCIE
jgi:hypothetical protein